MTGPVALGLAMAGMGRRLPTPVSALPVRLASGVEAHHMVCENYGSLCYVNSGVGRKGLVHLFDSEVNYLMSVELELTLWILRYVFVVS